MADVIVPRKNAKSTLGWMAGYQGVAGYGVWALYWYQESERVIWYDEATGAVTVGPAYLGMRDGWEDALYLQELRRRLTHTVRPAFGLPRGRPRTMCPHRQ